MHGRSGGELGAARTHSLTCTCTRSQPLIAADACSTIANQPSRQHYEHSTSQPQPHSTATRIAGARPLALALPAAAQPPPLPFAFPLAITITISLSLSCRSSAPQLEQQSKSQSIAATQAIVQPLAVASPQPATAPPIALPLPLPLAFALLRIAGQQRRLWFWLRLQLSFRLRLRSSGLSARSARAVGGESAAAHDGRRAAPTLLALRTHLSHQHQAVAARKRVRWKHDEAARAAVAAKDQSNRQLSRARAQLLSPLVWLGFSAAMPLSYLRTGEMPEKR